MPDEPNPDKAPFQFREEDRYVTWEEDGEEITMDLNAFMGEFDKVAELLNLPPEEVESFSAEMRAYHAACEADYEAQRKLREAEAEAERAFQKFTQALADHGGGSDLVH